MSLEIAKENKTMMNRVEMNEEMMAQVNGGREFNIGDHVEVKNTFFGNRCNQININSIIKFIIQTIY